VLQKWGRFLYDRDPQKWFSKFHDFVKRAPKQALQHTKVQKYQKISFVGRFCETTCGVAALHLPHTPPFPSSSLLVTSTLLHFFRFIFWGYPESTLGHMSKKKAPNYCALPVTGGHSGPNGKRASFFPVIFQSFKSLPVVTDGHIKGVPTLPLFRRSPIAPENLGGKLPVFFSFSNPETCV
jgi:hypothetical protein